MARYRRPVLQIVPVTLTPAEKSALTRRAWRLRFDLVHKHTELHPIVQILNVAHDFKCYELTHAALALWESANAETQVRWERDAFHARRIHSYAEGRNGDAILRMVSRLFGEAATPAEPKRRAPRPGELRLRPHYLTPVPSYPSGD